MSIRTDAADAVRGVLDAWRGWLCFDSCSAIEAYFVSDLPPDQLAPLVEKALRDSGFEDRRDVAGYGSGMQLCGRRSTRCVLGGPTVYDKGWAAFKTDIRTGKESGWVNVGVRADGTYGVAVVLIAGS